MKYIILVSREVWPAFNSVYAYTKLKKEFPSKILILYTDGKVVARLKNKITLLYRENNKSLKIQTVKIEGSVEDMRKVMSKMVNDGDVVDITGARKSMLLALMDMKNVHMVYLLLKDMRFSSNPFMMRPMALQSLLEVQR